MIRDFLLCADPRSSNAYERTVAVDNATVETALRAYRFEWPHPVRVLNTLTRAAYGRVPAGAAGEW